MQLPAGSSARHRGGVPLTPRLDLELEPDVHRHPFWFVFCRLACPVDRFPSPVLDAKKNRPTRAARRKTGRRAALAHPSSLALLSHASSVVVVNMVVTSPLFLFVVFRVRTTTATATATATAAVTGKVDAKTESVWLGHPRHLVFDNSTGFDAKLSRLTTAASRLVGLPCPPRKLCKFLLYEPPPPLEEFPVPTKEFHAEKVCAHVRGQHVCWEPGRPCLCHLSGCAFKTKVVGMLFFLCFSWSTAVGILTLLLVCLAAEDIYTRMRSEQCEELGNIPRTFRGLPVAGD